MNYDNIRHREQGERGIFGIPPSGKIPALKNLAERRHFSLKRPFFSKIYVNLTKFRRNLA